MKNYFWQKIFYGSFLALWIQISQCAPSFHRSQEDLSQPPLTVKGKSFSPCNLPDLENAFIVPDISEEKRQEELILSEFCKNSSMVLQPKFSMPQESDPLKNFPEILSSHYSSEQNLEPQEHISSFEGSLVKQENLNSQNCLRNFFPENSPFLVFNNIEEETLLHPKFNTPEELDPLTNFHEIFSSNCPSGQNPTPQENISLSALSEKPEKLHIVTESLDIHNSPKDFFCKNAPSWIFSSEQEEKYIAKIFSKPLFTLSKKEKNDAIVFLITKDISLKTIVKLFLVQPYIIEAFKICPPLDPQETFENCKAKAIELLRENHPIIKISPIVHLSFRDIKNIANEAGLQTSATINTFGTPELFIEMDKKTPNDQKQQRAILLLKMGIPICKIVTIVHIGEFYIRKLAEQHNITTRKKIDSFKAPKEIKEYMENMSTYSSEIQKEKRALILLKNNVPLREIKKITHMGDFNIKKLIEKHGFFIRKKTNTFKIPDEIQEYMKEMPFNTSRKEKEERILFLLKNNVPIIKIQRIVHISYLNIKKLAEENNIVIKKTKKTSQFLPTQKEHIKEIDQNSLMDEKEKRALFLLEKKTPIIDITKIVHMDRLSIEKLAEKNGIAMSKKIISLPPLCDIGEYANEMPHNSSRKEKEKRALILLEHNIPIKNIAYIVHMDSFDIKKLAEKNNIAVRRRRTLHEDFSKIKDYMIEMPENTSLKKREKRALFLLKNHVPIMKIKKIIRGSFGFIKKLAEQYKITTRERKKS